MAIPRPGRGPDDSDEVPALRFLCRRAMNLIASELEPRTWQASWRVAVEERAPGDIASSRASTIPG